MVEPTQMLVNGIAISLEIAGFCVMLIQTRLADHRGGGFSTGYLDKKKERQPKSMVFIDNLKHYTIGIGLVIAGLAGQIIAMFV